MFTKKDNPCFYIESRGVILFGSTALTLPDGFKFDGEEILRGQIILLRFVDISFPASQKIYLRKDLVLSIFDQRNVSAGYLLSQPVQYDR